MYGIVTSSTRVRVSTVGILAVQSAVSMGS